jgi:hypothetical protein
MSSLVLRTNSIRRRRTSSTTSSWSAVCSRVSGWKRSISVPTLVSATFDVPCFHAPCIPVDYGAVYTIKPLGITLSAIGDVAFDMPTGSTSGYAALRDAATGLTGLYSIALDTGSTAATLVGPIANGALQIAGLAVVPRTTLLTAPDAGGGPHVRVVEFPSARVTWDFNAYDPSFFGGVRVGIADVTRDGVPDYFTVQGPGGTGPARYINGATRVPFDYGFLDSSWVNGSFIGGSQLTIDTAPQILMSGDQGAAGGVAINARNGFTAGYINAYPGFTGGARFAIADFNGDNIYEV